MVHISKVELRLITGVWGPWCPLILLHNAVLLSDQMNDFKILIIFGQMRQNKEMIKK